MTQRTKRTRRMNAAEIAFDLADKRVKAREAAGKLRAEERRAAADPGTWGIATDTDLPANEDVKSERSTRGGHTSALRSDAFVLLVERRSIEPEHAKAADRLGKCIATAQRRPNFARPTLEVIDCGAVGYDERDSAQSKAEDERNAVLLLVGPSSARLLVALLTPIHVDARPIAWRGIVERETGETRPEVQVAMVRRACIDLVEAYRVRDHLPRKAA